METHHSRKGGRSERHGAYARRRHSKKERPEAALCAAAAAFHRENHSEIGISSIRLGSVTGIHEVLISTGAETLSSKHEAHDRRLFAEGALRAAVFLCGRQPGLYDMDDLFEGRRPMKTAKFGGTSLADAARFRQVKRIVSADPELRFVVVSAPESALRRTKR